MKFKELRALSAKNYRQGNAVLGGQIFMLASGVQIGWIFSNDLKNFSWADGRSNFLIVLTFILFYIAAIVGLLTACFLIDHLSKKIIYVSLN